MPESSQPFIDRIDAAGVAIAISHAETALREGEALHRDFRPHIAGDYVAYMQRMAADGARITQLADDGEVRALGVWRTYLTTYCGKRFELDDLVTADSYRSKGYGKTLLHALESRARGLSCDAFLLSSATKRVEAHRFYFRERFAISSFLFAKALR